MTVDDLVFVGLNGYALALNRETGEIVWSNNKLKSGYVTLLLDGDRSYSPGRRQGVRGARSRTMSRTMIAAALLALAWVAGRAPPALNPARAVPAPPAARDWPTFGGTPHRNMVNLRERGLPQTWNVSPELRHNVLWTAKLGSRSYGGPTVAGGKIYVGTNNGSPRNRRDVGRRRDGKDEVLDKGVVLCFEEATGRFLWQHVND